jgi:hypothetical protein
MRFNNEQIKIVRTNVKKIAGRGAKVRVFSLRLNGSRGGEDFDLLPESDAPANAISRADLKLDLEEKRYLPLDIIFLKKAKIEVLLKRWLFQGVGIYDDSGSS